MFKKIALSVATLAVASTAVFAASHAGPFDAAIKARQAQMDLYQYNLVILGGMAQGKMEYNAEAATAAANNLAALVNLDQSTYWPAGSDSSAVEGTRALPALWEDFPGVMAEATKLSEGAAAMQTAAGGGLESLQAAIGPIGAACGSCHKAYRASE
ncbi:MAG: c-type cytochrome [Marinosulfonomonas sp.]